MLPEFNPAHIRIGVIGLGYVGLPLAVEFARKYSVVGFDIKQSRIDELRRGEDSTREVDPAELRQLFSAPAHEGVARSAGAVTGAPGRSGLAFTSTASDLEACTVFIITVPTPIDRYKRPDLAPLLRASETVGKVLKAGDVVIYESTVYPGAPEENCVPVLELHSGLKFNRDFHAGYSPERINPGDREHRLTAIKKVTSGSIPEAADLIRAAAFLSPSFITFSCFVRNGNEHLHPHQQRPDHDPVRHPRGIGAQSGRPD